MGCHKDKLYPSLRAKFDQNLFKILIFLLIINLIASLLRVISNNCLAGGLTRVEANYPPKNAQRRDLKK